MSSNPTGLHAPVTNKLTEAAEADITPMSTPPSPGAGESFPATLEFEEDITPPGGMESAPAAEQEWKAPDQQFRDIGEASFGPPKGQMETVHGVDNRVRIENTSDYPWRVNASLLITAADGSLWVGTAWFISPRTLATAGHCVYIKHSNVQNRNGWVQSIKVMPGRNGTSLPYDFVTATEFYTVRGWAENGDENYDYGAIVIPKDLGNETGFFGIGVYTDDDLKNTIANISGYPSDKDPGTQWYDKNKVAAVSASKVYYDIDTVGGQSGSAVYRILDGKQYGVAIHAYGGSTNNSGTRITNPVYTNLTNWAR